MAAQDYQDRPRIRRGGLLQGPFRAFAYPRFAAFWALSFMSIMSFFMVLIVRGWLILELTDSPFMVAAVNAAQLVPMMVLPLIGGALADRGGRKTLLMTTDTFNFLTLLAMGALVWFEFVEVWHVFALALANGVAFALAMPARSSLVPDLVRRMDIASAVALFSTIFSLGQVAGPTPAGFIIDSFGMAPSFFVAAALLMPALTGLAFFRVPSFAGRQRAAPGAERESMVQSMLSGVRYVRGQQLILALLLLGLIVMTFIMPFQAVLPVIVRDVLGQGPDALGILMTATGAGALLGSVSVAAARGMPQLITIMMSAGLLVGVVLALFVISDFYPFSVLLGLGLGLCVQLFMTSNLTLVQLATPDYLRARVISMRFILVGLGPIGIIGTGLAAEAFGAVPTLVTMGIVNCVCIGLVLSLLPAIRRARRQSAPAGREAQVSG